MPHSKQAKKRLKQSVKNRARNRTIKSLMRTRIKRVYQAIEEGDLDGARQALPLAMKELQKAAKRNVVHKNMASRKISRLNKRINQLEREMTQKATAE